VSPSRVPESTEPKSTSRRVGGPGPVCCPKERSRETSGRTCQLGFGTTPVLFPGLTSLKRPCQPFTFTRTDPFRARAATRHARRGLSFKSLSDNALVQGRRQQARPTDAYLGCRKQTVPLINTTLDHVAGGTMMRGQEASTRGGTFWGKEAFSVPSVTPWL
jgi:hypothetical protein